MNRQHNGGPAFPNVPSDPGYTCWDTGMTLRDYAQIEFTKAWIIALGRRHNERGYTDDAAANEAQRLGIIQTDAMLAAREKGAQS